MALWEKVIVNVEKGAKRIAVFSSFFSERVRAEIALVRLRIRRDQVVDIIREQEALIGRTMVSMRKKGQLPESTDVLLRDEFIVTALAEIEARNKDLEDIRSEIINEQRLREAAEKAGEASEP